MIKEEILKKIPLAIQNIVNDTHIVFPGFVNAHDHLDFNLFPQLSTRTYNDYIEWGEDLHARHQGEIQEVLSIPLALRIQLGILKNLINGFVGVAHHGGHQATIKSVTNFPVWLDYQYVHSIATDNLWKLKLNFPHRYPLMIHLGEGKSARATREIDHLIKWNLIRRKVVPIHALGMNAHLAKNFHAVVWCPDSNLNLYSHTLQPSSVFDATNVLFGTDSTLSASANTWDHFRRATDTQIVSEEMLFSILTSNSWKFFFKGSIPDCWIVAKKSNEKFLTSFFQINPADIMLVWINGESWLCDNSFDLKPKNGVAVRVDKSVKWIHAEFTTIVSNLEKMKVELPLNITSI